MRRRFALALALALVLPAAARAQTVLSDNFDAYASGSALQVGSQTASFTGSITGTTLAVSAIGSGTIGLYNAVNAGGSSLFDFVVGQISGTPGGIGSYTINQSDSQASQAMTSSLWGIGGPTTGGNNHALTTEAFSPPNSAGVGEYGDTSWAQRFLGVPFSQGNFSARIWFTGTPTWSDSTIGFNHFINLTAPTIVFGNSGGPPAGSVNLQAVDAGGTVRGSVNVTAGAWHLVSLGFNSTAGTNGCIMLSVDGVVLVSYQGPTASSGTPTVSVFNLASGTVGASPSAEAFIDNLVVTQGSACGGAPSILLE
jgi:hypothetical protein